jgi:hypothetical protein
MHPEAPAPIRQCLHGQAIVNLCRACVIYGHNRVMGQVHSDVRFRVGGRACHYALTCCLQHER